MAVSWRVAFMTGGRVEGEAREWRDLSISLRVDDACDAALTIAGRSMDAALVTELATDLLVYRGTQLMFRGRITTAEDQLDTERHSVAIKATDYRGLLDRRMVWDSDPVSFTQVPQAEIAWALINQSQSRPGGDLGITRGNIPQDRPRDRLFEAGQVVGGLIDGLSELIDGFDWEVTPELAFNVWHPWRGTTKATVLDYGGTVATLDRRSASGDFANVVRAVGAEGTAPVTVVADGASSDQRGLWETSVGDPDLLLQSTVADRAAGLLAERGTTRDVYTVELVPQCYGELVTPEPGDSYTLVVRSGRLDIQTTVRVTEVAFDATEDGDEIVKLALLTWVP